MDESINLLKTKVNVRDELQLNKTETVAFFKWLESINSRNKEVESAYSELKTTLRTIFKVKV